jgi:uncharacterized protein (TIGR02186 family)
MTGVMRGLLLLLALALPLRAEEIVSGVSTSDISITTDFNGTAILIYGAAMREAPPPDWPLLQVIVTVEGPATPLVIRKKQRVAGIWLNRGAVEIASAPSFYAVATTGELEAILSPEEDAKHHVSIPSTIRAIAGKEDEDTYVEALQRIREGTGQYRLAQNAVLLLRQSLFRTDVTLPANLVEGDYRVRIFLTRGGKVVDLQENVIDVRKAGLERWLYNLAMQQPLIYGLLSLVIAMLAGWGASELFRRLRL